MYILIDTYKQVNVGEPVVIRSDNNGGIGAFLISGEKIGYLAGAQPEGCVDYYTIAGSLYDNRVLGQVAIKCGKTVFLQTDSKLLRRSVVPQRVEVAGYGMMVCAR